MQSIISKSDKLPILNFSKQNFGLTLFKMLLDFGEIFNKVLICILKYKPEF